MPVRSHGIQLPLLAPDIVHDSKLSSPIEKDIRTVASVTPSFLTSNEAVVFSPGPLKLMLILLKLCTVSSPFSTVTTPKFFPSIDPPSDESLKTLPLLGTQVCPWMSMR